MSTTILRSRILDMAIRGQLVPQDPNEGTADDLLKAIAAQRGKPVTPITDNVPFEIPANWRWVKLGDMGIYRKGPFGSSLTKSMFVPKSDTTYKVYEQKNAINKNAEIGTYYISAEKYEEMKGFSVSPNDIIVSCAGTIGETFVIPQNAPKGIINQALMRVRLFNLSMMDYWLLYFDFVLRKESQNQSKGTAIKNIPPFEIFKQLPLPLPPLAEQHRIVAKVEELLGEVDKIEHAQTDITHAATILRSRVLDMAIQGKLTHSNTDEWTWDTITNVTDLISSRDSQIKTSEIMPCGKYAVVSQGQKLIDGYCDDESRVITTLPVILFGDHTRNVKFIDFPFVVGADGTKLHKCKNIDPKFCYYWVLWAADNMTNRGYERHYSLLKQTPLHLPPLPEQRRIVAKIEELFAEIDKLVK